jgi:tetratricopeptide (TPR) repeat protein
MYQANRGETSLAHITRRQLKEDQLQTTLEQFEEFAKTRYKEILTVAGIALAVVALAVGLKLYVDRQEAGANLALAEALETYGAYVGPAAPGTLPPGMVTYPTAEEKYKKALAQFLEVVEKYSSIPQPKAVGIARYHVGLCQGELGNHDAAIKTLQEAGTDSDPNIASLARLALAGELVKSGKIQEGVKIYQELADHPTPTVPETVARMAMADAYRGSQPAKARQLYEELAKRFASDASLAQSLKDQIASLPE